MFVHLRLRDAVLALLWDSWPVILLVLVVAGSMVVTCWRAP